MNSPARPSSAKTTRRKSKAPANQPELFHLYLRQPDRRLYPCVVLYDQQGMVAAQVTTLGYPVSELTAEQIEVLKTFRGAEQIRVKPVKPGRVVKGKWLPASPRQFSYMLSRPDVPNHRVNWLLRYEQSQAALAALEAANRPPLFDPHALSGLKGHQLPPGLQQRG